MNNHVFLMTSILTKRQQKYKFLSDYICSIFPFRNLFLVVHGVATKQKILYALKFLFLRLDWKGAKS